MEKELRAWKSKLENELAGLNREYQELTGKMTRVKEQIEAIERLLPNEGERQFVGFSLLKSQLPESDEGFTPAHVYWPVILQSLIELGGSARGEQVIEKVGGKLEHVLTKGDREMLPSGIDVRWRNRAAWQRYNMVRQGLLKAGSPRGIWEISEDGRRWFQEITKQPLEIGKR